MEFQGKRLFFIGIGFYDYEDIIRHAIEQKGACVTYVTSTTRSLKVRFFKKIGFSVISAKIERSLRQKNLKKGISNDFVFIIKGQYLTQEDIDLVRILNPNAKFILYLWDSLKRHDNAQLLLENFDNIWSFDRNDCLENSKFKFRPLFYRDAFSDSNKQYALSFIGWLHSDRLIVIRKLREELRNSGQKYFLKLYMGRFDYLVCRYFKKILSKDDKELVILTPMNYEKVQRVIMESQNVLDISHPLQSGLTIRTIEALAAGCHLLTTNKDIVNYLEINKNSYTLFDRDSLNDHLSLEIKQGQRPNCLFLDYFSLDTFLRQLFM